MGLGIEAAVAAQRPKLLFLTSPNNPDGSMIAEADLLRLLRLPVLVVLDEAYIEFSECAPHTSAHSAVRVGTFDREVPWKRKYTSPEQSALHIIRRLQTPAAASQVETTCVRLPDVQCFSVHVGAFARVGHPRGRSPHTSLRRESAHVGWMGKQASVASRWCYACPASVRTRTLSTNELAVFGSGSARAWAGCGSMAHCLLARVRVWFRERTRVG